MAMKVILTSYRQIFKNKNFHQITSLKHSGSSTSNHLDLSGIYPPIPTPFDKNESICYEQLKNNFNIWNRISFRGRSYVFLSIISCKYILKYSKIS